MSSIRSVDELSDDEIVRAAKGKGANSAGGSGTSNDSLKRQIEAVTGKDIAVPSPAFFADFRYRYEQIMDTKGEGN